jgi:hypothetical protein
LSLSNLRIEGAESVLEKVDVFSLIKKDKTESKICRMMEFQSSRAIYIRPLEPNLPYGMGVTSFKGEIEITITTDHWYANPGFSWATLFILVSYALIMVPGMIIIEKHFEGQDTALEGKAVTKTMSENDWVTRRRNLKAKEKYRGQKCGLALCGRTERIEWTVQPPFWKGFQMIFNNMAAYYVQYTPFLAMVKVSGSCLLVGQISSLIIYYRNLEFASDSLRWLSLAFLIAPFIFFAFMSTFCTNDGPRKASHFSSFRTFFLSSTGHYEIETAD